VERLVANRSLRTKGRGQEGSLGRRSELESSWLETGGGSEAWTEKALERQKFRRVSAAGSGQLVSVRTDSRKVTGFEVGKAGGTVRFRRLGSRATGKCPWSRGSGLARGSGGRDMKRESIVVRGTRQLRESVGVGETDGDKVSGGAYQHAGGWPQGSCGPREGRTTFREGKALKENLRNGSGTKQGREARVC